MFVLVFLKSRYFAWSCIQLDADQPGILPSLIGVFSVCGSRTCLPCVMMTLLIHVPCPILYCIVSYECLLMYVYFPLHISRFFACIYCFSIIVCFGMFICYTLCTLQKKEIKNIFIRQIAMVFQQISNTCKVMSILKGDNVRIYYFTG